MYAEKERLFKESIVDSFYNCYLDRDVIVTTLAGPNLWRIANLADMMLSPVEINSYEIDETTYQKQLDCKNYYLEPEIADITNVYHRDINKCIVSNFMDIDLMGTVLTQGNTIRQLLEQQSFLLGTKVFIGTFSIRGTGIQPTLDYIQNVIGLTLKSRVYVDKNDVVKDSNGQLQYCHTYKTYVNKRVSSFKLHHYSDKEGAMITFRIIYT